LETGHLPKDLKQICLSRAHYDDEQNYRLMGIRYNMDKFIGLPLKLSLMIHKSGISTERELSKYISWGKKFTKNVVIRQLFEYDNEMYQKYYKKEFVPTSKIFVDDIYPQKRLENGNRLVTFDGIEVEIEEVSCACESTNPVLHANGKLSAGWA
jgi:hypothetical protein